MLRLLTLALLAVLATPLSSAQTVQAALRGPFTVTRIADGDTFTVEGLSANIRVIGVDALDTRNRDKIQSQAAQLGVSEQTVTQLGNQASAYAKQMLLGRRVWLEQDATATDRYGRVLAYVYLEHPQGTWRHPGHPKPLIQYNQQLLLAGWAETLTIAPNIRYVELLRTAQQTAQNQRRGIWAQTLDRP